MQLAVQNHILLLIDDGAQCDETPNEDPMEDDPSGKGLVDVTTLVDHSGARPKAQKLIHGAHYNKTLYKEPELHEKILQELCCNLRTSESTEIEDCNVPLPNSSDMQTFLADKQHSNIIREMAQSNASVSKKSVTFRKAECLEQQLTLKRTPGNP
jgi:hypothetical protein